MAQHIDSVVINAKGRGSVEYAKARAAIELDASDIARHNQARAHNWTKRVKGVVIDHLHGEIRKGKDGKPDSVVFKDGSVAKL